MKKSKIMVLAWSISDVLFYAGLLSESEVHIVCGRLSSYLYSKMIFDNVYPFYRTYKISDNQLIDGRSYHEKMSQYDLKFYKMTNPVINVDIDKLENDASALFNISEFDLLLLPGEFRLREQVLQRFKPKVLPIIYWEAGPVGSVYFSTSGTNARSNLLQAYGEAGVGSFIKNFDVSLERYNTKFSFLIPLLKMVEYFYLLYTVVVRRCDEFHEFLPNKKSVPASIASKAQCEDSIAEGYIIFYGQVERDVNYTHFAPDIADLRRLFVEWKREYSKYKVILKAHPREGLNTVNKLLIEIFSDSLELYNAKHMSLCDSADNVHHVTINSNIIAELLQQGKTVVVLGETLYDGLPGVVSSLSEPKVPSEDISKAIEKFLQDCFFPLNYRQKTWRKCTGMTNLLLDIGGSKHD